MLLWSRVGLLILYDAGAVGVADRGDMGDAEVHRATSATWGLQGTVLWGPRGTLLVAPMGAPRDTARGTYA